MRLARPATLALAIGLLAGLVALALIELGIPAGDAPAPARRPNVLLITVDTQRADHSSCYGYPRTTTPRLDALAAAGSLFATAYTAIPTTGPSHAGLFTSAYPLTHGVLRNGAVLTPEATSLAELLADAGYATAAVVSAYPLARRFGYAQGFASYDDAFPAAHASLRLPEWEGERVESAGFDRRADATTARAIRWLAGATPARPFLLWVHYYDPHEPYDPPRRYADLHGDGSSPLEQAVASYDGEIRFADEQLGRLIDAHDGMVGAPNTIVILATDHGEGLMQHGWMGHGANLYEELVRTVLVFRWPGRILAGRRFTEPVGLIDVAPTVLSLAGVASSSLRPRGVDLSATLFGGTPPPADRPLYFQRRTYPEGSGNAVPGELFGVRLGRWKYIAESAHASPELFDLAADPGETRNLRAAEPATAAELDAALQAWRAAEARAEASPEGRISPEDAARLRALGYLE